MRSASVDELILVRGMTEELAQRIWEYFHTVKDAKPTDAAIAGMEETPDDVEEIAPMEFGDTQSGLEETKSQQSS